MLYEWYALACLQEIAMTKIRKAMHEIQLKINHINQGKGNLLLMVLFIAILVAIALVAPRQPTHPRAPVIDEHGNEVPPALRITEVMSHNETTLPDEMGIFSNWVELTNEGNIPLELENYGLTNRGNKLKFIFPQGAVLNPGERVLVFASNRSQAELGKPYHAKFGITTAERTVFLFSPSGSPVEYVTIPALTADQSYAKMPDGWVVTDFPTPGDENTQDKYLESLSSMCLETDALRLSEIIGSQQTTLPDEDGEYHGWIKLYNDSNQVIDLADFTLSKRPMIRERWHFPEGSIIEPHEYFLVFCSGKDKSGGEGLHPHANFELPLENGIVLLNNINGYLHDFVAYDSLPICK